MPPSGFDPLSNQLVKINGPWINQIFKIQSALIWFWTHKILFLKMFLFDKPTFGTP